jgi:hypothetical protein
MRRKTDIIKLCCPTCGLYINTTTVLNDANREFFMYVCPKCESNVVYYQNRIDVISDKLVASLFDNKLVTPRGPKNKSKPEKQAKVVKKTKKIKKTDHHISDDDVLNLRIDLELSESVDDFLKNI